MSISLSGDIGTIITALGTVVIGVIQVWQGRRSKKWRDDAGQKINEVHAATAAIAEQTGTHQALPPEAGQ